MNEHKIKIGFIITTRQFIECALTVARQKNENIDVALVGSDNAIEVAKRMQKDGVEVIVSRRGMAHLLRENLTIPVLSVPLTSFDILYIIKEVPPFEKKVLLTVFGNAPNGLEIIDNIFGIELVPGVYQKLDDLERVIIWGKDQGCKSVIGGGMSMSLARKHGLTGLEIHISEEGIATAIEDAKSIAQFQRDEKEKSLRYRAIIDSSPEGIITVNRDGKITIFNKAAKTFLNIPDEKVVGKHITKYIPNASILDVMNSNTRQLNHVEEHKTNQFLANHMPISDGKEVIGGISILKDTSNIMQAENEIRRSITKRFIAKYTINDFIYNDWTMKRLVDKVRKFAATNSTVLIAGETGTGKEIIAQGIHNVGLQRQGPFVSINCAALPDQLLESELFGYAEGAFTGSRRGGKPGLFELAHKGTIFLDEIGATNFTVQTRLLRVLQEKEVMRIGGESLIPITVRVIAAANQNLIKEVKSGRFREDLFFRINVLTLNIPPLRERIEDLPFLINALIKRSASYYRYSPFKIPERYINKLKELSWPGNVRQLVNFIEKLVILSGEVFDTKIFDELYSELVEYSLIQEMPHKHGQVSFKQRLRIKSSKDEFRMIHEALEETRFDKNAAAKKLGISRTTLWRKLKTLNFDRQDFTQDIINTS